MTKKLLTQSEVDPNAHLDYLSSIALGDVEGLKEGHKQYGDSWKKRGGVGAFMVSIRKIDRLEQHMKKVGYDIFKAIEEDQRPEGVIDDICDFRRYLMLIEAEMRARGFEATHRDNVPSDMEPSYTGRTDESI